MSSAVAVREADDLQVLAALDLVPCALLRTDPWGTILRVNGTLCRWLGHEPQQLVGRKLQDLMTMGARIFHQTHVAPLLEMQGSVSELKLEFLCSDGSKLPMVINAQRHDGPQGPFVELALFVARDRDKYERELLASRQRLEQALAEVKAHQEAARDRAMLAEQMVGIVSHDLRNPLQTIHMGTVLLSRGDATPHQLSVLGRIGRATERAHRLIGDLLDFTQARLGRGLPVQRRPLQLHALVAEAVDELGQAFPGRLLTHEHGGEGACVADGDRIAQLVGNLVANAMSYGAPGSPVTVRSDVQHSEAVLSVHNTGSPIPLQAQARLFRPLVRGANDGAARSVGLGLFIVAEIAKAHGGSVTVASSAEAGTTFSVRLPAPTSSAPASA